MLYPLRRALTRRIAFAFVIIWALGMGCNPSVITALGGNPVSTTNSPDGYIVMMIMDKTTDPIKISVDITKKNAATKRWDLSTGPLGVFMFVQDCDVATMQFVNFQYTSTTGAVDVPANLGVLTADKDFSCGKVITVTASGTPPTFSVQVF